MVERVLEIGRVFMMAYRTPSAIGIAGYVRQAIDETASHAKYDAFGFAERRTRFLQIYDGLRYVLTVVGRAAVSPASAHPFSKRSRRISVSHKYYTVPGIALARATEEYYEQADRHDALDEPHHVAVWLQGHALDGHAVRHFGDARNSARHGTGRDP